jgi:hypothetical protein
LGEKSLNAIMKLQENTRNQPNSLEYDYQDKRWGEYEQEKKEMYEQTFNKYPYKHVDIQKYIMEAI